VTQVVQGMVRDKGASWTRWWTVDMCESRRLFDRLKNFQSFT